MNEWMNEWVIWLGLLLIMNEWMNECSLWMNEWMNEWMSVPGGKSAAWAASDLDYAYYEWMNERINEWMSVPGGKSAAWAASDWDYAGDAHAEWNLAEIYSSADARGPLKKI